MLQEGFGFVSDLLAEGGGFEDLDLAAPAQQPLQQVALVADAEGDQQAIGAKRFVCSSIMAVICVRSWFGVDANSVCTCPGCTEFTRIPRGASSMAAAFVMPRTAHLLAM